MPQHTDLATATLHLLNTAKTETTDNNLAVAQTVRAWLRDIGSGALTVVDLRDKPDVQPIVKAA